MWKKRIFVMHMVPMTICKMHSILNVRVFKAKENSHAPASCHNLFALVSCVLPILLKFHPPSLPHPLIMYRLTPEEEGRLAEHCLKIWPAPEILQHFKLLIKVACSYACFVLKKKSLRNLFLEYFPLFAKMD